MKELACIVPARSGSKRLINKNLLKINNKSLIQYAIDFALDIKANKVIFSSDSLDYFESIENKRNIIFHHRQQESSSDSATDFDLVLELFHKGFINENTILVWLRPTSPIRNINECIQAIRFFDEENQFNSLRSVQKVKQHPYWMKEIKENNELKEFLKNKNEGSYPNSQSLPILFYPSCEFDLARVKSVLEQSKLIASPTASYVTSQESTDIDDQNDYDYTKFLMRND